MSVSQHWGSRVMSAALWISNCYCTVPDAVLAHDSQQLRHYELPNLEALNIT